MAGRIAAPLTRSFHKLQDVTTALPRQKGLAMQRLSRLTLAALITLGLAACASNPQPDLTPPTSKRLDAKTTLENRR